LSEKCIDLVTNKKLGTSTLQTLTSSLDLVMLNNTRLISLSRTILSTSVKMNDSERLAVLQEIERQTIEQERKVSKVSRIISQYERLKRALR
ncbi:conjugal transfer protein TraI, partial [Phocaeicola dorei]